MVARRATTSGGPPLMGQSSSSPPASATASRTACLRPMSTVLISRCTVPGRMVVSVPCGPQTTLLTASASGTIDTSTSALAATSAAETATVPPASASSGEPDRR